jgi:hypothetical protein
MEPIMSIKQRLSDRIKISPNEYDQIMLHREQNYGAKSM